MKTAKKFACILLAIATVFTLLFANGNIFSISAEPEEPRVILDEDFESGSLNGWYDNTTTLYDDVLAATNSANHGYVYHKIDKDPADATNNTLWISHISTSTSNYLRQYDLGEAVSTAVLEYRFRPQSFSKGHQGTFLPVLLYKGAADHEGDKGAAPFQLFIQSNGTTPILLYNYGQNIGAAKVNIQNLSWDTWYTLRVEYDLPNKSVEVYLNGSKLSLPTDGLTVTSDNINAEAKLDRISVGMAAGYNSYTRLDDIKVTTTEESSIPVPEEPAEILEAAFALEAGQSLPYKATLSGTIVSIDTPWDKNTQKITFTMEVDEADGQTISCSLGSDPGDKLAVGDGITVKGTITNDNGTVGFAYGSGVEEWRAVLRYGHSITEDFDFGSSMVVCGDSITEGIYVKNGVGTYITPYCTLLKDMIPSITTYLNKGKSSMFIYDPNNQTNSIYNQVMSITGSWDTIFIAGGINDFIFGHTLGSPTDTTNTTFYGCLYKICEFLKTNYPNSNVVFMTPLVDEATLYEIYPSVNPYRNAIHEVARRYGYNVIEGSLMGISGTKNDLVWDGIHPSQEGHQLIAENLYNLLGNPNAFTVTVGGNGAGAAAGFATTGMKGQDYTLTITPVAGYQYAVTATVNGEAAAVTANGNSYTVSAVDGALNFTVTASVKTDNVSVHNYVAMQDTNMWLVLQAEDLGEKAHATYNGDTMLYSEKYGAYAALVVANTLDLNQAKAQIGITAGKATAVHYNTDINRTGRVDANDAQYVYNMYASGYTDITEDESVIEFLRADANGDKKISVVDAIAVYKTIGTIPDEEPVFIPEYVTEGDILLYHADLTTQNADIKGTQTFDSFGLKVDGQKVLTKAYGISDRTVYYTCKFNADTGARFTTTVKNGNNYTINTDVIILMSSKQVVTSMAWESVPFLNDTDPFRIAISKNFLALTIEITNLRTGEYKKILQTNSGVGGAGEGAVGTATKTGMQYDYYTLDVHSGSGFSVSEIAVSCGDYDMLIYGDSITEPEAYWPAETFQNSWVQKLIRNFNGKAMSSGRSGCTIDSVLERIKNELPYIKPKYCMVTIGTNGGNTEAKLTELVQYIKSQGVTPILNHIPCYDNGGDTTGFIAINRMIDTVRQKEGIKGCDFDLATSVNRDGKTIDRTTMWLEDYGATDYYHHPNEKGSAQMFAQLQADLPELFRKDPLPTEGKICVTFGDSITEADGRNFSNGKEAGKRTAGYQHYMRTELGFAEVINKGYSGAYMSYIVENIIKKETDAAFWQRLDYMTLMAGTNDERWGSPLGTLKPKGSNFDTTTYIGALQSGIEYALSKNPNLTIVLFTPIKGWIYAPNGYVTSANPQTKDGIVSEKWADAVKEVAQLYGLTVCDLYNESGIEYDLAHREAYMNDEEPPKNTYYSVHPNSVGHELMSHAIIDTFKAMQ